MATAIIQHGAVSVDFPDRRFRSRRDDIDEVTQTFQRATTTAFQVGQMFPGLSDFKVAEVNRVDEVPGNHVYELKGVGGLGITGLREVGRQEQVAEEGFDTIAVRYVSTSPRPIQLGQQLVSAGFLGEVGTLYCVEVQSEQHPGSPDFWNVAVTYRGIIGQKEVKVKWNNSARELSKDEMVNGFPGGWETPEKSEILWGRSELTASYVTTTLPRSQIPQQGGDPPAPYLPGVFVPNFFTLDATLHWPNGWTLTNIATDIISGTTVTFVTEQWLFNPRVTI